MHAIRLLLYNMFQIWKIPELDEIHKIPAHELNVGAVVWHPGALVSIGEDECCLATCSANGEVMSF